MIANLKLKNVRGLKDLVLDGLQPVNLIVGRNNAGKTSLLEGIAMLGDQQKLHDMPQMFRNPENNAQDAYAWILRDGKDVKEGEIRGSGSDGEQVLWFLKPSLEAGRQHHFQQQGMAVVLQQQKLTVMKRPNEPALRISVVSIRPKQNEEIVRLFGSAVAKKGGEETMDRLFHEMDGRIRKVRVSAVNGLQIRFDLGLSEMLPMSQMGQGVEHLIRIFSQLISEGTDICLIDEIDNGIHHSMLEQVWLGIASASNELNIQVFATTHSYECIEAADAAFRKRKVYDFSIIQLFRVAEGIQGRVLDQKHIEAALSGGIDLR